ncbi:hypothetical protein RchiOBHm_Chr6g0270361 [Rosa chinensis]|uniref:Uncharacterized protein n=1 Tax=Rosa chinensis TaxID=74649 RepID=A0A2P6PQP4_ROSCH|nr:hypothetical protein RchiOBHm_Chr6g0270361 [Rosa chinensis]
MACSGQSRALFILLSLDNNIHSPFDTLRFATSLFLLFSFLMGFRFVCLPNALV